MAIATGVDHEDGQLIGYTSAKLVGFHGKTPCDQAAAITSVSTSVALSVCGVYGFTSTQANAIITAVNAVLAALNEKGLTA
jgi:hypothetical protein